MDILTRVHVRGASPRCQLSPGRTRKLIRRTWKKAWGVGVGVDGGRGVDGTPLLGLSCNKTYQDHYAFKEAQSRHFELFWPRT